ncbi:MAG: hypothetical protein ABW146_05235 [Candidatus Sedimenticola sp. 6PFRAG7]
MMRSTLAALALLASGVVMAGMITVTSERNSDGVLLITTGSGQVLTCSQVKNKSKYYSELRRKGGTVREMEGWKKVRRNYDEIFRDYCRYE